MRPRRSWNPPVNAPLTWIMTNALSPDEFAALVAIDSSMRQRRPSPEIEIKLRRLGLIERNGTSGLPARTAEGDRLVADGL